MWFPSWLYSCLGSNHPEWKRKGGSGDPRGSDTQEFVAACALCVKGIRPRQNWCSSDPTWADSGPTLHWTSLRAVLCQRWTWLWTDSQQFTSQVWKAFAKALGASASLSSGYHSQSNGQAESKPIFGVGHLLHCCCHPLSRKVTSGPLYSPPRSGK